jgi:hypothetical protein
MRFNSWYRRELVDDRFELILETTEQKPADCLVAGAYRCIERLAEQNS